MTNGTFEGWAIVELLGHRALAGMAREVEVLGVQMLRLDVALPGGFAVPQFYPPASIYGLTLTDAEQVEEWRTRNEQELWGHSLLSPDALKRRELRLIPRYEVLQQADLDRVAAALDEDDDDGEDAPR